MDPALKRSCLTIRAKRSNTEIFFSNFLGADNFPGISAKRYLSVGISDFFGPHHFKWNTPTPPSESGPKVYLRAPFSCTSSKAEILMVRRFHPFQESINNVQNGCIVTGEAQEIQFSDDFLEGFELLRRASSLVL